MSMNSKMMAQLSSHFSPQLPLQPVEIGPPIRFSSRVARIVTIRKSNSIMDRLSVSELDVTVISGRCEVSFDGTNMVLGPHESLTIPRMAEHAILAIDDVRLVVSF